MVWRRDRVTGAPGFKGSGFLLTSRLAITVRHGLDVAGRYQYEVVPALPRGDAATRSVLVEQVVLHQDPDLDMALLVLASDAGDFPAVRLGVLPTTSGRIPFRTVGFPDFAVDKQLATTRQVDGDILLGSFAGRPQIELALNSPAPAPGSPTGSPWTGISGAGVLTEAGTLVGICSSHHVPGGPGSITATSLETMDGDAAFVRHLRDHGVDPDLFSIAPKDEPGDWLHGVLTHDQVVRGLLGRRAYLTNSQLAFVGPGRGHESDPLRLLSRLSDPLQRGALLIGPAGAGKTRTCFEVAAAADRAGWRVLHIQANSSVTLEDLYQPVLEGDAHHVLLVFDYLDACPQLDLRAFADSFLPEAKRRGVTVACLGSARPGARQSLQQRGAGLLFDEVFLRQDVDHQSSVITHILREIAPRALRRWGKEELSRVCGRRPVIALLIASSIERRLLDGRPVPELARVRPGELLAWLQEWMRRDSLAPGMSEGPDNPLFSTAPRADQLAIAVAVTACPQPRRVVEEAVDAFLEARPGHEHWAPGGRQVVDTLLSLGWMDESEGQLDVVHDIVTDELMLRSLLPPPGWSVHEASASSLLEAASRRPRTFAIFTSHLRRMVADLDSKAPGSQADAVQRFCGEWLVRNADRLGRLFERSGKDGERALLTMVISDPWQAATAAKWETVVSPWLSQAELGHMAGPFLIAALANPHGTPRSLIAAALSWLGRRSGQTDAYRVLRALLARKDLTPDEEQRLVELALAWVRVNPGWPAASEMLGRLLVRQHGEEQLRVVAEQAIDWLRPVRSPDAAAVLNGLLERDGLADDQRQRAAEHGLGWLRGSRGTTVEAIGFFRVLLGSNRMTNGQSRAVIELAFSWLATNHANPSAISAMLRAILDKPYLAPELAARINSFAEAWNVNQPLSRHYGPVLRALLARPETRQGASLLLEGLSVAGDPSAATTIHQLLEADLAPDRVGRVVALAFEWLERNGDADDARIVVVALLGRAELTPEQSDRAAQLAVNELTTRPDQPALLARTLSTREVLLTDEQADLVIETALRWAAGHPAGKDQRRVLNALLGRKDLQGEQARKAIELGLTKLGESPELAKARVILSSLLERTDLSPEQTFRVFGYASRWLDANALSHRALPVILALLGRGDVPAALDVAAVRHARACLEANPGAPGTPLLVAHLDARAKGARWVREASRADFTDRPHLRS